MRAWHHLTLTAMLLVGVPAVVQSQGVPGQVPAQLPPTGLPDGLELKPDGRKAPFRQVFDTPRVNGLVVDHCETWGTNCEGGGAQAYCRSHGFAHAVGWNSFQPGETWVLGSKAKCSGSICTGYALVVCER